MSICSLEAFPSCFYSTSVTTQPRHSERPKGVEESLVGVTFAIASGDSSIPFDYAQGRLLRSLGMTYQESLSSNRPAWILGQNLGGLTGTGYSTVAFPAG